MLTGYRKLSEHFGYGREREVAKEIIKRNADVCGLIVRHGMAKQGELDAFVKWAETHVNYAPAYPDGVPPTPCNVICIARIAPETYLTPTYANVLDEETDPTPINSTDGFNRSVQHL